MTDFQPDLVGLSLRNLDNNSYLDPQWVLPITKEVVDAVRSVSEAPIVLGGPAFSLYPKECFDYVQPDVGIYGDGGEAFAQLADSIESGEDFHRLPGMVYPLRRWGGVRQWPSLLHLHNASEVRRPGHGTVREGRLRHWGGDQAGGQLHRDFARVQAEPKLESSPAHRGRHK